MKSEGAASAKPARGHFFRRLARWQIQVLIVLIALLVGLRIALPWIVKWYVNKTLDEMPEYAGSIGDVDIKLWRGAYQIQKVDIIKTDGDVPVPFFSASNVEFSVQWQALFDGALVAEIEFFNPVVNFVNGPTEETSQVGVDKPWLDVIKKLFPLDINRFEVHNGSVHYRDFHSRPKVDLVIDRIAALATNLTNSKKLSQTLVAKIDMTGRVFKESKITLHTDLDPEPDQPTFNLDLKIDPFPLTRLNNFSEAYAAFDFEKGTMEVAIELAAKDGKLSGYVKPILDDMSVVSLKEDSRNPLKLVWESVVGGVTRLFRNQPNNRFATKIPINGTLKNPKIGIFPTLGNFLKNEFIRIYEGDLENTVSLDDAATGKVQAGDDKKKLAREKKEEEKKEEEKKEEEKKEEEKKEEAATKPARERSSR